MYAIMHDGQYICVGGGGGHNQDVTSWCGWGAATARLAQATVTAVVLQ